VVTIALPGGGEGMIRVHGELWRASSRNEVPIGAKVRVLQVEGLKLDVEPLPAGTSIEK
jgi:membrane protein implicated in regulation of membrane protease activity